MGLFDLLSGGQEGDSYLPAFKIIRNGDDVSEKISPRVLSIEVVDSVDENTDSMRIVLDSAIDGEKKLEVPRPGDRLEIYLGYGKALERIGNAFVIDEVHISGPPLQVEVTGSSTPFTADNSISSGTMATRRSQSYSNTTLGALLKTLAARNKLKSMCDEELAGTAIDHIDQVDESDINLLLRIVRRCGGVLKPMDGALVIVQEGSGKTAGGEDVAYTVAPDEVANFKVVHGSRMADIKQVKASAIDYNEAKTKDVSFGVKKGELWEASK
jgi:hypothetical protein